jgi:hypothetical protein
LKTIITAVYHIAADFRNIRLFEGLLYLLLVQGTRRYYFFFFSRRIDK